MVGQTGKLVELDAKMMNSECSEQLLLRMVYGELKKLDASSHWPDV